MRRGALLLLTRSGPNIFRGADTEHPTETEATLSRQRVLFFIPMLTRFSYGLAQRDQSVVRTLVICFG